MQRPAASLKRVRAEARHKSTNATKYKRASRRALPRRAIFTPSRRIAIFVTRGSQSPREAMMLRPACSAAPTTSLWSSPEQQSVVALKRQVLETGEPADCEASYITPERRALFALHIDPLFAADGSGRRRHVHGGRYQPHPIARKRAAPADRRTGDRGAALRIRAARFERRGVHAGYATCATPRSASRCSALRRRCHAGQDRRRTCFRLGAARR